MDDTGRPYPVFKPIISPPPPPNQLAIHKNSHAIAKVKPKIRIIHVFSPQVIKTDVANFRELVQRLTGKPGEEDTTKAIGKCKRRRSMVTAPTPSEKLEEKIRGAATDNKEAKKMCKKLELFQGDQGSPISLTKVDKLKLEMGNYGWGGDHRSSSSSSSGFLDGFSDVNYGFMHDLLDGFPLANPSTSSRDHQHHHHRHMDFFW